jgi:misacylated tRNA(Ala) deacylase
LSEALFRADAYASRCEARVIEVSDGAVVLDQTVFYPTGGGQPGDRGRLVPAGVPAVEVIDTLKGEAGVIVHRLAEAAAPPVAGTALVAEIDWPRRHRLMRMHSALHLLCAAVACPVTGGQVGNGKSRLDFDLQGASLDKDEIAERIGRWIVEDHSVRDHWIDADELERRPELVRTMSVRPPSLAGRVRLVEIEGIDLQACGGTHVRSTAEIGRLLVGKIENKGRQNRRISLTLAD